MKESNKTRDFLNLVLVVVVVVFCQYVIWVTLDYGLFANIIVTVANVLLIIFIVIPLLKKIVS